MSGNVETALATPNIPPLPMGKRLNLSIMMFLEFAIWGAWFVVFTGYLTHHKFSATQAGQIFGTMALGAVLSPSLIGFIADRYLSSEKVMAILHLAGAGCLYWMAQIQDPNQYYLLYAVTLLYALIYNPTLALTNSITFTHIPDATRDFPGIRVLGTIGWIVVNWYVGKYLDTTTNAPLMLAGALSVVLAAWSLFLPHTPPQGKAGDAMPYKKALGLFKDSSFAVFFGISFIITIVLAFYYSFTFPYLTEQLKVEDVPPAFSFFFETENDAGEPAVDVASTMTIGQIAEMVLLPILPFVLYKFGMKWVLAFGMVAWGIRYAIFSVGDPFWLMIFAVALHGICFDFFFAAAFIHVDNTAPRDIRASAQALFAMLTYGLGMWIGSILSGILLDYYTDAETGVKDWQTYWIVPSVGVFISVAIFVLFFRMKSPKQVATTVDTEGQEPSKD